MSRIVLLDSSPLGLASHPQGNDIAQACQTWLAELSLRNYIALIPEIADYEVRRELLRAGKTRSIRRLDQLNQAFIYLPLTTATMIQAAELWAIARRTGQATADPKALDGDVILAAQALLVQREGHEVIVATSNVGHLARFITAADWQTI
jgi:predicted nucleic acid-binding protein